MRLRASGSEDEDTAGLGRSGPKRLALIGQSMSALPGFSDLNLFRYRERVVDLNTKIPDSAFDFGVPERKLYGP